MARFHMPCAACSTSWRDFDVLRVRIRRQYQQNYVDLAAVPIGEFSGRGVRAFFSIPGAGQNPPSGPYYVSNATGNLAVSGVSDKFLQKPTTTALDPTFPVLPPVMLTWVLHEGSILFLSQNADRLLSNTSAGIREDDLAADNETVLASKIYTSYEQFFLSGYMRDSPEGAPAQYPIARWIASYGFVTNARWQSGASYLKKIGQRLGDTIFIEDCHGTATITPDEAPVPTPCVRGNILNRAFFPVSLFERPGHPEETWFEEDGTYTTMQGVSVWISNTPLAAAHEYTLSRRVFLQLNGHVYVGLLQSDGTPLRYRQTDGSVVAYSVLLDKGAAASVQRGLITGSIAPVANADSSQEIADSLDLFGIGGHGVNGFRALGPARSLQCARQSGRRWPNRGDH